MKTRLLLVLSTALALFVAAERASAVDTTPYYQRLCSYRCNQPGATCTTSCEGLMGPTTCGVHWGGPATDYDRDGVANSSDNCICTANANQANCDGDALGNACDATDNSWTRTAVGTQACHIGIGGNDIFKTITIYYRDLYTSACTGVTCVKKVRMAELDCGFSVTQSCCDNQWPSYLDCHAIPWGTNFCGTPVCPF